MCYLKLFEKFKMELIKNEVFFSNLENISQKYLKFFGSDINKLKYEYEEYCKFNTHQNYNFNEYVYYEKIKFNCELKEKYKELKKDADLRKLNYEKKIKDLEEKLGKVKSKYEKEKLKFFIEINSNLYKEASKDANEENIKKECIYQCDKMCNLFVNFNKDKYKYYNINQYEDINWRVYLTFSTVVAGKIYKACELYENDKSEYLKFFYEETNLTKIKESILVKCSENYKLKKRFKLIKKGLEFYEINEYLIFINLLILQVEGLFNDYMDLLGIKSDGNSISYKLKTLQNAENIYGYAYYAFEFPVLRNAIAHGEIIEENLEEISNNILMDIYILTEKITCKEIPLNYIIWFLKESKNKENINAFFIENIIELDKKKCIENYIFGKLND
ncbi:hypothetical protein, partial [Paraclostridium bifermentans]